MEDEQIMADLKAAGWIRDHKNPRLWYSPKQNLLIPQSIAWRTLMDLKYRRGELGSK